jgi:carboxymethylenebutenolidase
MGEMIEFKRPDGKTCPAYLAAPLITGDQERTNAPGIVVIQEWWGLNDQIKKTGDRFAQAGFRALVPDLFRGKVAKAADEARHLMTGLNFPDAASQDVRGALQYLKLTTKKAAVAGFCMGGALTIMAAAKAPEMDAGACFYGIPPLSTEELQSIKIPLICHFGNKDHSWPPEKVNALEAALKQSQSKFELYRYDADHAFMNEQRPEVYNPAAAKLAWDRAITFLRKHLPSAASATQA